MNTTSHTETTKKPSFDFPVGTKIESFDKYGCFNMHGCGEIAANLGEGHSIIKTWRGEFYSSIGINDIVEVVEITQNKG